MSLANFLHRADEEKTKEKHVPCMELKGNEVSIRCGATVMHPATEKHYIGTIRLYGVTKEGGIHLEIGCQQLWPGLGEPVATFRVSEIEKYKGLLAVSYCNLHGNWENYLEL
ncbi:Superoxide reductase (Desulfoferredoxin) [Giardia muris]|uniref:Desulfoferredoxin (Superoxide reductase) n=1 Tax=Giardia muris TaxID=5742 RepID=A0A3S7RNC9_GIAMU|nr:Desulfoferredoxin (Superoxide reductase) [Giardia muris]TNJ27319.1 Superoxide reductase (Desulfoferredoxin) [Giardia muris]|eukprot:TNJ27319.1 Superoxide reductase (Desulfoferredoxin) [Giardia muris]